ncbi:LysR family transcriptional regulator [Clostridiaceae bacterium 35-E11]
MIDIKLVTFITVAKTKNFTRAADILNITQPAISQHIKVLEEYYGVKLLYKKGRQMELTEEGKLLFKRALKLDRLSKIIKSELKNQSSFIKRYNVGATLTIGGYVLPEIIGQHKKQYENIDIILYVENTEIIIKKLFAGEIHLGVIEGPFNKDKVKYQKFKDDELILAVSPLHGFAEKEFVTIEEVLKEKLILREKGSGTRQVFEDYLLRAGYSLENKDIYMEIGNITALISLVESNVGCTIVSKEAIKTSLQNNTLKTIPIKDLKMMRAFHFIYLDKTHEEFIHHFMKFCRESLFHNQQD